MLELDEYWDEEPPTRVLLRLFLDYKPPTKNDEIDHKILNQFVGTQPKKLSGAPAYLQLAAARLKEEMKDGG